MGSRWTTGSPTSPRSPVCVAMPATTAARSSLTPTRWRTRSINTTRWSRRRRSPIRASATPIGCRSSPHRSSPTGGGSGPSGQRSRTAGSTTAKSSSRNGSDRLSWGVASKSALGLYPLPNHDRRADFGGPTASEQRELVASNAGVGEFVQRGAADHRAERRHELGVRERRHTEFAGLKTLALVYIWVVAHNQRGLDIQHVAVCQAGMDDPLDQLFVGALHLGGQRDAHALHQPSAAHMTAGVQPRARNP